MTVLSRRILTLTCAVFVLLQVLHVIMPSEWLLSFLWFVRPACIAVLAVIVHVYLGKDAHPVSKSFETMMIAIVAVVLYAAAFIILAFWLEGGNNIWAPRSFPGIMREVWAQGVVLILVEFIRFRIIKATGGNMTAAVWLIVSITLLQVGALRDFIRPSGVTVAPENLFFAGYFIAGVLNGVLTLFAMRGRIWSVLLVSVVYNLVTSFAPWLPHITPIAWSLVISAILLLVCAVLYIVTRDNRRHVRRNARRASKYMKKSPWRYSFDIAVISLIIAFFVGVFPIYPTVILTGSMAGTMDQGSLAFVRRVPPGEAFARVGEGYIIHIRRGRLEFIHRTVDFRHDAHGERVYVTQGDANYVIDPFVTAQEDVLGVVVAHIPFIGFPYVIMQSMRGRI